MVAPHLYGGNDQVRDKKYRTARKGRYGKINPDTALDRQHKKHRQSR